MKFFIIIILNFRVLLSIYKTIKHRRHSIVIQAVELNIDFNFLQTATKIQNLTNIY